MMHPNTCHSEVKVSIIVAVYNGAKTFQRCIDSIANQTYKNIELIIIDGASTDGTVDMIKANEEYISYWESGPDRGIYHAWNKGVKQAKGEWIAFIGCDDELAYDSALSEMLDLADEGINFISGRMKILFENGAVEKGEPWGLARMRKWQNIAHPGSLHHRTLFEQFGNFDENYKIAGDYDFLLRASEEIKGAFLDKVLVLMGAEGVSNTNIFPVLKEAFQVQRKCEVIGLLRAVINFIVAYLKVFVRKVI